jgi:hypothetical protein
MRIVVLIGFAALSLVGVVTSASPQKPLPMIDMHMHALRTTVDLRLKPMCAEVTRMPVWSQSNLNGK